MLIVNGGGACRGGIASLGQALRTGIAAVNLAVEGSDASDDGKDGSDGIDNDVPRLRDHQGRSQKRRTVSPAGSAIVYTEPCSCIY